MEVNASIALGNNVFSDDDDAAKAKLREAILRHVRTQPDAADTVDGIIGWWLPRTGYADAPDHIDAVLEDMVARNWLQTRKMPDGEILYLRGDAAGASVRETAMAKLQNKANTGKP